MKLPEGSLLNPASYRAVSAGNVETSQRIVDTVYGALAQALPDVIPAASNGSMNNVLIGGFDAERNRRFTYYETLGGWRGRRAATPRLERRAQPHDQHPQYSRRGDRSRVPLPYRRVQHP